MSNSSRDFPFELFLLWGHGRPIVGSESPPTVTTRLMQQQQQQNKNLHKADVNEEKNELPNQNERRTFF
jgi:hypothetical protein